MTRLTPEAETLIAFLRQNIAMRASGRVHPDLHYLCYEDLAIRHGRLFTLDRTDRPERDFSATTAKECFTNALMGAVQHDDLTYVEGYADNGLLPIHHAWLIDEQGRVYDPTWENLPDGDTRRDAYLGVPFETDFVVQTTLDKGSDTLFDWRMDGVSLEREIEEGAVKPVTVGVPVPESLWDVDEELLAELKRAREHATKGRG